MAADPLREAQRKLTAKVMGRPGVIGTAIAMSKGDHCLKVLIEDARGRRAIPKEVDGYRVVVEDTGRIRRR